MSCTNPPKVNSCRKPARRSGLNSYTAIVTNYLAEYAENAEREIRSFQGQSSLDDAVENAALAKLPSGKRAHHQRRIPQSKLRAALKALRRCDFESCSDFDELFCLVEESVLPISGIGELYVYDTAFRIGAFLGLSPDYIYLHAGVRAGARALGFSGGDYIECSELPLEFLVLEPHQIEDCLCIYKRELAVVRGKQSHAI